MKAQNRGKFPQAARSSVPAGRAEEECAMRSKAMKRLAVGVLAAVLTVGSPGAAWAGPGAGSAGWVGGLSWLWSWLSGWEKEGPGWTPNGFQSENSPFDDEGPGYDPSGLRVAPSAGLGRVPPSPELGEVIEKEGPGWDPYGLQSDHGPYDQTGPIWGPSG